MRTYYSVADQKLLDHNDNGLKRWKYEIEGSLSRYGLGSFENLLNRFQVSSTKGIGRSNAPDATFAHHFQYFSQVIIITAQKMKFSIEKFFSKCVQIHRKIRIWPHLLKKSLMENFIFCAVNLPYFAIPSNKK